MQGVVTQEHNIYSNIQIFLTFFRCFFASQDAQKKGKDALRFFIFLKKSCILVFVHVFVFLYNCFVSVIACDRVVVL